MLNNTKEIPYDILAEREVSLFEAIPIKMPDISKAVMLIKRKTKKWSKGSI